MKDLPHHIKKLVKKITRSEKREAKEDEEEWKENYRKPLNEKQKKKQSKQKIKEEKENQTIYPKDVEEKNQEMKHRTPQIKERGKDTPHTK